VGTVSSTLLGGLWPEHLVLGLFSLARPIPSSIAQPCLPADSG